MMQSNVEVYIIYLYVDDSDSVGIYSVYLYVDDSDSEEEADKSNKCVLVWEVR